MAVIGGAMMHIGNFEVYIEYSTEQRWEGVLKTLGNL